MCVCGGEGGGRKGESIGNPLAVTLIMPMSLYFSA